MSTHKTDEVELINEGSFGCIYHPGIQCNGRKEDKRYITKIQKQTETTTNEVRIGQIIQKKIHAFRNYFSPIVKQCPVKIGHKYVDKIKQCKVFEKESDSQIETSVYVSNKILFLGNSDLQKYLHSVLPQDTIFHPVVPPPYAFWKAVLDTHIRLLQGIQLLLRAGILHMDIKSNNIMVEPVQDHPIFIDFGISIDHSSLSKNAKSSFYIYDAYTPWCIDVLMCNYVVQIIGSSNAPSTHIRDTDVEEILQTYEYGALSEKNTRQRIQNDIFRGTLFSPETLETFRQNLRAYFKNRYVSQNATWQEVYAEMTTRTYVSWDNYSVGAMYKGILESAQEHEESILDQPTHIARPYREILHSVIYSTPDKRPTVDETLHELIRLQREWTDAE